MLIFLNFDEKYKYTTMVRATLSRYELIWLYYNSLSDVGRKKFKKLVEIYSLLKNMRENLLTFCNENDALLLAKNLNRDVFIKEGFSGTDYEFFITTGNDEQKYNISAFYSTDELEKGKKLVEKWQFFYDENH